MLQKVSTDDVSTYQSYTIRQLNQESSMPNTHQYKVTNVRENTVSNRLKSCVFPLPFRLVYLVSHTNVTFTFETM